MNVAIGWDILLEKPDLLRPGDIGFQRSTSFLSEGIRDFTEHPLEEETFASHTFMVLFPALGRLVRSEAYYPDIIEAQDEVRINALTEYRNDDSDTAVFRVPELKEEDELRLQSAAISYLGEKYPYEKIALKAIDHLLGDGNIYDRLSLRSNRYCNALVERIYKDADWSIAVWDDDEGSPDDLMDRFIRKKYPLVWVSSERTLELLKQIYPALQV